jgi:hypothetical protein
MYGSSGTGPAYNSKPTTEQTKAFLDSIPQFRALDEVYKINLINGAPGAWLSMPILPNGSQNPLYNPSTGSVAPNWYLPATWPSTWVGVWQQPQFRLRSGQLQSHKQHQHPRISTVQLESEYGADANDVTVNGH